MIICRLCTGCDNLTDLVSINGIKTIKATEFRWTNLNTVEILSSVITIKAMDSYSSKLSPPFYIYSNTLQEIILREKTSIPSGFENGWNITGFDEETNENV